MLLIQYSPAMKPCGCVNSPSPIAFLAVFVLFIFSWNVESAPKPLAQFGSRLWQTADGLPHSSVQAIAQTSDGYLWVGTSKGLARFDGMRFVTFEHRDAPVQIVNASITALSAGEAGSLWIGCRDEGLVSLHDGNFSVYSEKDGLVCNSIRALHRSRHDSLWIGTTNGLARYRDGRFRDFTRANGLPNNVVRSINEGPTGDIWIGGFGFVGRMNPASARFEIAMEGTPSTVRTIYQDTRSNVWAGTSAGLSELAGAEIRRHTRAEGLPDNIVNAIFEDSTGVLWVGTSGGLCRRVDGTFITETDNEGVSYDMVNVIYEDREGNIWIGAKDGLYRLSARRFVSFSKLQGLRHNNVMSVCESRSGAIWLGTWGGGVNQLKQEIVAALPRQIRIDDQPRNLTLSLALHEARDGSFWIGTDYDAGLFNWRNGKFIHIGKAEGLHDSAIKVIYEDRATNLWVGTSTGLNLLRNGKFTRFTATNGLAGTAVRAVCEDDSGRLWIGTDGGLTCRANDSFFNFGPREGWSGAPVLCLYSDQQQALWIGTEGHGLARMMPSGGTTNFVFCTTRHGLISDHVLEVIEDDDGWMWLASLKGVFRVKKTDLDDFAAGKIQRVSSTAYGQADGMLSVQCNGVAKPSAWKSRDGRLWFATTKGVVAVDPKIKMNEKPPAVVIEDVLADKRRVAIQPPSITIPPGRGELEFRYTALSFTAPEKNQFKYKLEGIDPDWVEAGSRRSAFYNNVSPGDYRFHVIACNNDGAWNSSGSSVKLSLQPHFWQTWWFSGAAILSGAIAVSGAARFVTRKRLQRELDRLERQHILEKERARIAQDIHDDLGSSLTRIAMLGERAREDLANPAAAETHVGKIVICAHESVRSLDEIVWAVNPAHDTLDSLAEYISHFTNEFFQNTSIQCRLEIPMDLPSYPLPADMRHNVFLAVKEALNNVLKHSQATEVCVRMSESASRVQVLIEDNGCGFDSRMTGMGNGLGNMRKRLEELGGRFDISSAAGHGAKIKLEIDLSRR